MAPEVPSSSWVSTMGVLPALVPSYRLRELWEAPAPPWAIPTRELGHGWARSDSNA